MRFYDMMIFIFIFNISSGVVNSLNLFGLDNSVLEVNGQQPQDYAQTNINHLNGSIATVTGTGAAAGALSWLNLVYQFIIVIIPQILNVFLQTTIGFPLLLNAILAQLGMASPGLLSIPLGALVIFIEVFGMAQFMTGRSFREAE